MGPDCSIVFYRGTPLSPADLSQVFRRAPGLEQTYVTLAACHAELVAVSPEEPAAATQIHAVSAFTKAARFKRITTEPRVDEPSFSGRVKSVLKSVFRGEPEDRVIDQYPGLPDDWLVRVAAEISRIRERALWAMIASQAHTGGFALCKAGAVVEDRTCDGETWQDLPNLALARFAGVKGADIHHGFHHPAEPLTANTSYIVVTDRGEFLDPPRPVAARDIAGFSHLL